MYINLYALYCLFKLTIQSLHRLYTYETFTYARTYMYNVHTCTYSYYVNSCLNFYCKLTMISDLVIMLIHLTMLRLSVFFLLLCICEIFIISNLYSSFTSWCLAKKKTSGFILLEYCSGVERFFFMYVFARKGQKYAVSLVMQSSYRY